MVKLNNYAKEEEPRKGSRWFRWKVFIDAPPEELEFIEEVKYTLHPTFPDPIRIEKDKGNKFALESAGWGEFTIQADVRFRDGHTDVLTHWLDLGASWPSGE